MLPSWAWSQGRQISLPRAILSSPPDGAPLPPVSPGIPPHTHPKHTPTPNQAAKCPFCCVSDQPRPLSEPLTYKLCLCASPTTPAPPLKMSLHPPHTLHSPGATRASVSVATFQEHPSQLLWELVGSGPGQQGRGQQAWPWTASPVLPPFLEALGTCASISPLVRWARIPVSRGCCEGHRGGGGVKCQAQGRCSLHGSPDAGRTTGRLHTQCDPSEQANSKESEASVLSEEEARPLTLCQVPRARAGRPWAPGIGTGPVGGCLLEGRVSELWKGEGTKGTAAKGRQGSAWGRPRQVQAAGQLQRAFSAQQPLPLGARSEGRSRKWSWFPWLPEPGHSWPCLPMAWAPCAPLSQQTRS